MSPLHTGTLLPFPKIVDHRAETKDTPALTFSPDSNTNKLTTLPSAFC